MSAIFRRIVLSVLLLLPVIAFCQKYEKKKISSSFTKSRSSDPDIFTLISQAEAISEKDPKRALDYLQQALSLSLKESNKKGEAMSYATLGKINYQQGLYSQSIEFSNKALASYEEINDAEGISETRKYLGYGYEGNGNYDKALEQYQIVLSKTSARPDQAVLIKNRIAGMYVKQAKYDEAIKVYKEVLALEEARKNSSGIIEANNNIGNIYLMQEKTKNALKHYENAQEIAIKEEKKDKLVESYGNISKTFQLEGKYSDELEIRNQSAKVNAELNNKNALAEDYLKIGQVYIQQRLVDKAVYFLDKSIDLAEESGDIERKAYALQAISEAYKQQKKYVQALNYFKLYVNAKDTLLARRERSLSKAVSFADELTLKQKHIDLLQKDMQLSSQTIQLLQEEQNFSKLVIYFLSAGLMIVFGSAWFIYSSARKRRIANQELALKSLRSQMNPHFIFNALNSVNNYISKSDERSANKYLSDFSKLMRTVMENSQHEFITLTTELNILQLYLSLEHSRFPEKFDYELKVAEDIFPDQIELPPMLIQPYIENAVWHGLRYREDKGTLRVSISLHNAILKVIVEDNGIGRKKSVALKTANQKDKVSTGLKNTESRLKIINELYRTRMKVEIEDLYPETESGTRVTIYITQAKPRS